MSSIPGIRVTHKTNPHKKCRSNTATTVPGSADSRSWYKHTSGDQALLHAVYPPTTDTSIGPLVSVPERSLGFRTCPRTNYKYGYSPAHSVNSVMDKSLLPPGMSSTSSPQQSRPPINPLTRRQSPMPPSPPPHSPSPTQDQDVPGLGPRPPDAPSTFTNSSTSYPSPPLLGHGVTHAAPQPSLPHAYHSHLHMVHSSPPFVYHHHPGTPGREASMSHMAYAPPSMMSMLRQHPHAPVYSYQGASTEPSPSPHRTYGAGPTSPLPVYPRHPISSSHSFAPRQASSASTGEVQYLTSYPSQGTYSPLGYTTPPPFAYPPTSFVPAPSIFYGPHYPHHTPSYGSPPEQENQGAWWYPTSGSQSQFSLPHPSSVPQHEDEWSGPTRTASPPYPSTLKKSPFHSRFGDPSDLRTEIRLSSIPSASTSSLQARTTETPPPSESWRYGPQERRSYHPKTPAHRSEWVMWVGNVPSDATPDELRAFFNRRLPPHSPSPSTMSPNPPQVYGGVSSVFLIARSNCAFVNFESEAQLEAAVARFHGKPIRPDNPPCPRLVCRVRRRTDDLKAGVGAQRGHGMHVKWIKEQRKTVKGEEADLVGLDKVIGGLPSPLSTSDDDGQGVSSTPCSSISLASTDSAILTRYFPQRYFILKSLTQHDLDLSVQRNIWATQPHNEEILDQAYRTSKDVFLIFGVNKSGEFYGYSRMAGRILHSEDRVPWASRPTSPLRPSTVSDVKGNVRISPPASIVQGYQDAPYVLSPEAVEQSPKPISPPQKGEPQVSSAPAELHDPHHRLSQPSQNTGAGFPRSIRSLPFELHADGPYRALRDQSIPQTSQPTIPSPSGEMEDTQVHSGDAALQTVAEEISEDIDAPNEGLAEAWGRPFRVDWIRTDHLSFSRVKHLRNPWNHGREVKISRDGTELEPSIGRQLLEEWDKRPPSPSDIPAPTDSPRTAQRRYGSKKT